MSLSSSVPVDLREVTVTYRRFVIYLPTETKIALKPPFEHVAH